MTLQRQIERMKAAIFVYVVRPMLPPGDVRDCPCCGELLEWYDDYGWLHLADGDADCYGALAYGKGPYRKGYIRP